MRLTEGMSKDLKSNHPAQTSSQNTSSSVPSNPGRLQTSLSNLSQSSVASALDSATSASRSQSSGASRQSFVFPASSQDSVGEHTQNLPVTPGLAAHHRVRSSASTPSSGVSDSPTHGSKRAADGTVKSEGVMAAVSPAAAKGQAMHARNTSLDSTSSRISELSAQLRARLSYAAVKVQNGWENQSISEVEDLASHASTPASAPNSEMRAAASGASTPNANLASLASHSNNLSNITGQFPPVALAKSTSRPGTAHSAWHHPAVHHISHSTALQDAKLRPSPALAPAPDLTPSRSARRSGARPAHYAPRMPDASVNGVTGAGSMTPTPQEQDAVDTLLFMSSPANSAAYARERERDRQAAARNRSPAEFARPPSGGMLSPSAKAGRVNGAEVGEASELSSGDEVGYARGVKESDSKRRSLGSLRTARDVDLFLDEMGKGSSSASVEEEREERRDGVGVGVRGEPGRALYVRM